MKLFIISIVLFLSNMGWADTTSLAKGTLPAEVSQAIDLIYELGRNQADTGGISQLDVYQNVNNLTDEEIIKEILFSDSGMSDSVCYSVDKTTCAKLVLAGDETIMANNQYTDPIAFINDLKEWQFEDEQVVWDNAVLKVKDFFLNSAGQDYSIYSFGYDYIADVFQIVTISKDRKTIIVISGDLGA